MKVTREIAERVGGQIGVDFGKTSIREFTRGLKVELEHLDTIRDYVPNAKGRELEIAGSIAMDHLDEYPDYYTRLRKVEN